METKCWKSVLTFWCRCVSMNVSRLNGTVFRWANSKSGGACKNWHLRVNQMLIDSDYGIYTDISQNVRKVEILRNVLPFITQRYIDQWTADINRQNACTGTCGNKL